MKSRLSTIIILLMAIGLFMLSAPLWATGDCKGRSCNDGGDVDVDIRTGGTDIDIGGTEVNVPVSTNVTTGGMEVNSPVTVHGDKNKAYALSNNLGDVDIAGCLGSTQWGTPLFSKQKLVVNWPCLAEFYLRNGLFENAAMAICNTEVRKEFETEDECRAAHPFQVIATQPAAAPEPDHDDEDYEALKAELEAVKAEAAKAKQEARYAVREAKKQQPQYGLTQEQREQLAQVFIK